MTTITISKTELLSRLQPVSKIISSRPALPIMDNILLDIKNGTVRISAADTIGRINTSIEGILADNDFSICIEPKILIEALNTLTEQPLTITINENNLNVLVKYNGGKFELTGKPAIQFPEEKDIKAFGITEFPLNIFIPGINKTIACAANDELRPVMNSVYIELGGGSFNHVASDGKLLALSEHKDAAYNERLSFVLPSKIASILKKIFPLSDDILKIHVGGNHVRFEYGTDSIVARLEEGAFPNYRSVIPKGNGKVMTIGTSELKSALNRVMVFANQTSHIVKFRLTENQLLISGQDIDFSTCADENVSCEYSGPVFEIGLHGQWLNELLKEISHNEIAMSFSDPLRAALITPTNNDEVNKLTYLIVPLTLNN